MFQALRRLLLLSVFAVGGCDPIYVTRAAFEHGKILYRQRPIVEILKEDYTSERSAKLVTVLSARSFATSLGMNPKGSFTHYSELERDELAWVLIAARPEKFLMVHWWYPIVGSVPYKGFFNREDADSAARTLEDEGYESSVRATDAISTLGWFDDPVLSTTLNRDPVRVVDTVLHESLHSTVWIPGHVDFNESLANVIGVVGAAQFFSRQVSSCEGECKEIGQYREFACRSVSFVVDFGFFIESLYRELEMLYSQDLDKNLVLTRRQEIFNLKRGELLKRYPSVRLFEKLNNAELMQLRLYYRDIVRFFLLLQRYRFSISDALDEVHKIREHIARDGGDPFAMLPESGTSIPQDFKGEVCQINLPTD